MTRTITFRYIGTQETSLETALTFEVTDMPELAARLVAGDVSGLSSDEVAEATAHAVHVFQTEPERNDS